MLFNPATPTKTIKQRNSYKDCEARHMPLSVETPSWILIYKDVTVLILPGEDPISIEITNNEIANSFKQYFDAFWKLTKK